MASNQISVDRSAAYASDATTVWHPKRRFNWRGIGLHAILISFCAFVLLPLAWVVLLSLKTLPDAYQRYIWPRDFIAPLYEHYRWVWVNQPDVRQNFTNSVYVTLGTVVIATVASVLAGYALVHLRLPGRRLIVAILVASLFFPTRVTALIGIYEVQDRLDLINKTWSLMLPYTALTVALSVFIMRGVFESVPKDLVDSAKIDGAGSMRTLLSIVLPLVRNGIVVVIIVNFVAAWGEYLLALTLMNDASARTLPVFIASASGGMGTWVWPRLAALYIIAIIPALIAFAIAQRWYMKGLQEGALKT